jgi:CDP-glucose 4,6-dehydratase
MGNLTLNPSGSVDFCSTYKNLRVLLTGHTGFKGSWLATWLVKLGAEVIGLSQPPAIQPNMFEAIGLADRIASHFLDIRNRHQTLSAVKDFAPTLVLHLAAQSLVRRSYADPIETFETNVLGTANVLQACLEAESVRAVVCITTDKVYLNREWDWPYRENDNLGGLDPYSASKACAEHVAYVYQRNLSSHRANLKIATARGGNVIGGGDWCNDRIIPDIVRALTANEPIRLRNPLAVRPWQHVLELCEGYLELGSRLIAGEAVDDAWNFGPNLTNQINVENLVKTTLMSWGRPDWPIQLEASDLHESRLLRLDISKALSRLAWRPRLNIEQTLQWTTEWYRRFYQNRDHAWSATSDQIDRFQALRAS